MNGSTLPARRAVRATRGPRALRAVAALGACALLATGCGTTTGTSAGGGDSAIARLQVMAPADAGGGWDTSARQLAAVMESEGLVDSATVTNVGGAGGTVGLAELATERSEDFLMIMGLVMVGAIETNGSQATLEDTTPLARLTSEDEIVVVPADSPYRTMDDLVQDMQDNGAAVSIAGGSAGGTDHILAGLIAQAGSVDIADLNYVPFSGGGESLAALLGSNVSAGISGVGEYREQVEAGTLRALAVSGEQPVDGIDAPTLTEAGYDIVLSNWRGVVAPPGISDAAQQRLLTLVDDTVTSEAWAQTLQTQGWGDAYLAGPEFQTFLGDEQDRVRTVLGDLGLI